MLSVFISCKIRGFGDAVMTAMRYAGPRDANAEDSCSPTEKAGRGEDMAGTGRGDCVK